MLSYLAVLHLEFQNYGGLSVTQLKNVGDLKTRTPRVGCVAL
jgi:hypothetical protein